jgi:hypothetical protein
MRKYCLDCVIKHISQAFVLQIESEMGYPDHILLAIGHLAEASEECRGASQELADEIRQYRLVLMADPSSEIPYYELYNKVKQLIVQKGCGDCKKASEDFKERILKAKSVSK